MSRAAEGNQALAQIVPRHPVEQTALRNQAELAFQAAEQDYAAALERQPTDDFRYVLLVNRGGMYLQAGNFARSLADLEAGIRLRPRPYQAYVTLAQLHQRRGQLDLASRAFGRAIDRAADPVIKGLDPSQPGLAPRQPPRCEFPGARRRDSRSR